MTVKTLYTLAEVASLLDRSVKSVRHLADRKRLPTRKLGGQRVVTLATLATFDPELWQSVLLRQKFTDAARRKAS